MSNFNDERIVIVGPGKEFLSGVTYHTIYLANSLDQKSRVFPILIRRLLPRTLFPGRARVGERLSSLEMKVRERDTYESLNYANPFTWGSAFARIWLVNPSLIIAAWWTSAVAVVLVPILLPYRLFRKTLFLIEAHEVVDPGEKRTILSKFGMLIGALLFRIADGIVVQSADYRDEITATFKTRALVAVIPEGSFDHMQIISQSEAKRRIGVSGQVVILYFGLIRRYKGVPLLIDAFNTIPSDLIQPTKLIIAGEIWEDQSVIVDRIRLSPRRNQIQLIPRYLDDNEVATLFAASDVVVLPYVTASGSGVSQLCLHFGKKVVYSDIPSFRSDFGGYANGITFQSRDVNDLARALVESIRNPIKATPLAIRKFDDVAAEYLAFAHSIRATRSKSSNR